MTVDKLGPYELNSIITGDARELAKAIPDESIDLIFTDPPYPRKYINIYNYLGQFGGRILGQNRRFLSIVGHYQVPEAMEAFSQSLIYDWIIANAAPGRTAAMFQKRVWATWKPCLVYRKGTINNHMNFANDLFTIDKEAFSYAKTFHKWGQGAPFFAYYIDRWTKQGDIVFDPFTGGGTVPAVCKMLNRRYLAFEIDPETAALARERVRLTQPPLPIEYPEQLEIEAIA